MSDQGMTAVDLASATAASVPTVHRALADLLKSGWLDDRSSGVSCLSRSAALVIGVDVGRAHRRSGCAGPHGSIIGKPFEDPNRKPDDFGPALLHGVVDLVVGAIDEANATGRSADEPPYRLDEIQAIGVGIPFPVSHDGVTVGMFAPQLSGLRLAEILTELLKQKAVQLGTALHPDLVIRFAKDGDLGAIAAWRDHLRACRRGERTLTDPNEHGLVFAKASFGFDAGIICHGQLVAGVRGLAGQIGHMWVPRLEEPLQTRIYGAHEQTGFKWPTKPCSRCGHVNCLENVASGRAILEQLKDSTDQGVHAATVEQLVEYLNTEQTERTAMRNAVIGAARITGVTLADATRLADPAEIIVGGLLAEAGDTFITPLKIAFAEAALPGLEPDVRAVAKTRVQKIELEGAIALALRHVLLHWR